MYTLRRVRAHFLNFRLLNFSLHKLWNSSKIFCLIHVVRVWTHPNVSVWTALNHFLQLNRSKGRPTLRGVNTITISASCCCGGRRKQGVEERQRWWEEDEREPARADRESQLWHDSDKLPCIYSNCVTWSFGWVVMCVFRDWPCWWANTNKTAKWRTDSELSGWSSDNQNIQLDDMNSKLKNTSAVSHKLFFGLNFLFTF